MAQMQIRKRWYFAIALLGFYSNVDAAQNVAGAVGGGIWRLLKKVPIQDMVNGAGTMIRNTTDFVGARMDAQQKANADRLKAKEDAARKEEQRLNELLNDPTTPKDVRAQILRQRENLAKSIQDAKDRAAEREAEIQAMGIDTVKAGRDLIMTQLAKAGDHGRNLQLANAQAFQARKGTAEAAKAYIDGILAQPGKIVAMSAGVIFSYYFIKYGAQYVDEQLRLPQLAEETSLVSSKQKMVNWLTGAKLESSLSDVILAPEIAAQINTVSESLGNIVKNNSYLPNIMLWGPPGTGKTMVAKRLARSCGLDYIYFAASSLDKFSLEDALKNIADLFEAAKRNPKKLMVIIDEAEVALVQRRPDLPEKTRKIITQLLTYTGTETRDYMCVFMTNRPEDLDEAVLSRVDSRLYIGTPEDEQREGIVNLYIQKFLVNGEHLIKQPNGLWDWIFGGSAPPTKAAVEDGLFTEEYKKGLSDRLKGFTGRDISKLILAMLNSAYATADCKLTKAMVEKAVQTKLDEAKALEKGFVRAIVAK